MSARIPVCFLALVLACGVPCRASAAPELLIVQSAAADKGGGIWLERVSVESSEIKSSTVARNLKTPRIGLSPFSSVPSRFVVYQTTDGVWHKGEIMPGSGVSVSDIEAMLAPEHVDAFAVSHDGKKVAWVVLERRAAGRSRIFVTDFSAGRMEEVHVAPGYILCPAWSPDDSALAYYYAAHTQQRKSDCKLMKLQLAEGGVRETELGPECFPCDVTLATVEPRRTVPPLWSPDGEALLFEAAYERALDKAMYLVSATRPGKPRRVEALGWYRDSKRMFTFSPADEAEHLPRWANPYLEQIVCPDFGTGEQGRQVVVLSVPSAPADGVPTPTSLLVPPRSRHITCSPDGEFVAFKGELEVSPGPYLRFGFQGERAWLASVETGEQRVLLEAPHIYGIWWIE